MTIEERWLWEGLGYCYEWYRAHPEDKEECDRLARNHIRHGKVSADDVTEMLARGRVAFDKWKAMAKALDVEVAS